MQGRRAVQLSRCGGRWALRALQVAAAHRRKKTYMFFILYTFSPKKMLSKVATRSFHASRAALHKVAVLGAAGGIGAPLSLLLKDVDAITHLSLVDRSADVVGVAADVSHINTKAKVRSSLAPARGRAAAAGPCHAPPPPAPPRLPLTWFLPPLLPPPHPAPLHRSLATPPTTSRRRSLARRWWSSPRACPASPA